VSQKENASLFYAGTHSLVEEVAIHNINNSYWFMKNFSSVFLFCFVIHRLYEGLFPVFLVCFVIHQLYEGLFPIFSILF
jgi:hypothetical protein